MRKVLNGKNYNTATAKVVGGWKGSSDDYWYEETLHQKRGGEFFLHARGKIEERIVPLTYDEAREWASKNLDADECKALFRTSASDALTRSAAECLRLREQSGMNRKDFCHYVGLPYRTWQSWELGERECPARMFSLVETKLKYDGVIK